MAQQMHARNPTPPPLVMSANAPRCWRALAERFFVIITLPPPFPARFNRPKGEPLYCEPAVPADDSACFIWKIDARETYSSFGSPGREGESCGLQKFSSRAPTEPGAELKPSGKSAGCGARVLGREMNGRARPAG